MTINRKRLPATMKSKIRRWIMENEDIITSGTHTGREVCTMVRNDIPELKDWWYDGLLGIYCRTMDVKPVYRNGTLPQETGDTASIENQLIDHDERIARLAKAVTTLRTEVVQLRTMVQTTTDKWDLC